MKSDEILQIQKKIESLPKGSITVKKINGKEYEYWQFRENGRQITRRVKGEELEAYLNSPGNDRVFILYGLRRTGKRP